MLTHLGEKPESFFLKCVNLCVNLLLTPVNHDFVKRVDLRNRIYESLAYGIFGLVCRVLCLAFCPCTLSCALY